MTAEPPLAAVGAAGEVPATIAIAVAARALRAQGHDVISLAIGEPDFATPPHIVEAAHAAARRGETKYTPVDGTLALREAVRRKFTRENGIDAALAEIIVTNGSKQAIHDAFAATVEPGCEVVVPGPYWASYPLIARMLGAAPVFVPCREADGFRLDADALARAITPRTRWVVLNFPNNPTGAVCPADRLAAIGEVLARHPHVWVMSDDIYEHLIHDGSRHATLAAIRPDLRHRILTINGVSKSYAMTGWRIGYATGPRRLIAAMSAVQSNVTSGASSIGQAAAVAALDGDQAPREAMRIRFAARRDLAHALLSAAPGLTCARPDGAFFLFPNVAGLLGRRSAGGRLLLTDTDVAAALLEEAHVGAVPGAAFGASPYLRLSTACADDVLAEACRRVTEFCKNVR